MKRTSWDTSLKHLARQNLLEDLLSPEQLTLIPRSNIARWKKESKEKYLFSELNQIIHQEIDLIKKLNQSSKIKRLIQSYFHLSDTLHKILFQVKNIKPILKSQKEVIVNAIEKVKHIIPIENAIKIFNISRSTFENYKSIVIYKCSPSYFKWCTKRFSNQLLAKEVLTIKSYLTHEQYQYWSKSSTYLKAIRDNALKCSLSTFYKYARLLGFENKALRKKSDSYAPVRTTKPNELWCADVTIFKTKNGQKFHIHLLMDHFSKMILAYRITQRSSAKIIKELLQESILKYKPDKFTFLTDGGSENVNNTISSFLNKTNIPVKHLIAQKDVVFSNSMIEAAIKVIKHQFLYHRKISSTNKLLNDCDTLMLNYNNQRPQWSLKGNTPTECYNGKTMDFSQYTTTFAEQIALRVIENRRISCGKCQ